MSAASDMMLNSMVKMFGIDVKDLTQKGEDFHKFAETLAAAATESLRKQDEILRRLDAQDAQASTLQKIVAIKALSPVGNLADLTLEDDALLDPAWCIANGLKPVYTPEGSVVALSYRRRIAELVALPAPTQLQQDQLQHEQAGLDTFLSSHKQLAVYDG